MSGETEQNISAWTVDSLRAHFEEGMASRDLRHEQRFESQEKAINLAAERVVAEVASLRACYDALLAERDVRHGGMFEEREKAVLATIAAQRDYYDALLAERERRYAERFDTVAREFSERVTQVKAETVIAMAAAEKAISKAELATEKRFESVNEFRAQQADIIQTFARKSEIDTRMIGLTEKVDSYHAQTNASMPRAEYDRAHTDLTARVLQLEKQMNEKMEVTAKSIEQRFTQLQAQIASIEAVTR